MSDPADTQNNPLPYVVRLRERASRDIDAAYVRFAEITSETIAKEWREGLLDALTGLASMPRRFPLVPERFRREVRQMLYQRPGSQILRPSFKLIDVRQYQMGDQQNWVALFDYSGTAFALIPGSKVTLGCDHSRAFHPTPHQLASWQDTVEEWEVTETLDQHIRHVTTPLRTVNLHPFLLEVSASEQGLTPVEGCPGRFRIKTFSHTEARETAAQQGFRLPTSDE